MPVELWGTEGSVSHPIGRQVGGGDTQEKPGNEFEHSLASLLAGMDIKGLSDLRLQYKADTEEFGRIGDAMESIQRRSSANEG